MNPEKLICVHPARSTPPPQAQTAVWQLFPFPGHILFHTGLTLYGYMEAHLAPRILVYIYTVLLQEETLFIWSLVQARVWRPSQRLNFN